MSGGAVGGLFNQADNLTIRTLNHRMNRKNVITSNIANAETPGFRSIGYDFEGQLQDVAENSGKMKINASDSKHFLGEGSNADGSVNPDVYVRPTESVGNDGNTVDIDQEMARMAQNQILYRAAVESINRKVGILRYAINGGR